MLTLAAVVEGLTGRHPEAGWLEGRPLPGGVVTDSRQASANSLFVALRGERADGHDYAQDALQRGAVALLLSRPVVSSGTTFDLGKRALEPPQDAGPPYSLLVRDTLRGLHRLAAAWRARHQVRVIGVTGSTGKTSTKELIASVLGKHFRTLKSEGSLNNEVGLPLTLLCLNEGHQRVVVEMGMYTRGEIRDLARMAKPHIGVVTNVGSSHAQRAGSREKIAAAKAELVEALPADGVAILNIDDPYALAMRDKTQARVLTFGLDTAADVRAERVTSLGLEGMEFRVRYQRQAPFVRIPLLGRHAVHNALAAVAVGLAEDLTWAEIFAGLKDIKGQLRLLSVQGVNGSVLLDDTYNASPESTLAALNLLADLRGRRIAVLGDMLELGPYEEEGHRKVGRRAVEVCQLLVTVGPRGRLIGQEALRVGLGPDRVHSVETQEEAVALLGQIIAPGDFVLVKGSRAMHMEEIVAALSTSEGAED